MKQLCVRLVVFPLLVAATACVGASKSSNPLSPDIAGPIPGVGITAPQPVNPTVGAQIDTGAQPISLVISNSTTNGVRPLSYTFEVATDSGFTNKVFARDSVPQGDGGRTSVTLADRLQPERGYYWRARAGDGANSSEYNGPFPFTVFTP